MIKKLDLVWFYIISVIFIAVCVFSFAIDVPVAPFVPLVLIMLALGILSFDKFLLLIVFLVPVSIPVRDIGGGIGMNMPVEPMMALLAVGVVVKWLLSSSIDFRITKHPISIAIIAYTLWLLITTITSSMPIVSGKFLIAHLWFVILFYFTATQLFKKFNNIKAFIWCFTISLSLFAAYTLVLHSQFSFDRYSAYTISRPVYPDHGIYGATLAFIVPIIVAFIFYRRSLKISYLATSFLTGFLLVLVLSIVFSYTRAAWLSLVAALGAAVIFWFKIKMRTILLVMLGIIAVLIYKWPDIEQSLSHNKQRSDDDLDDHLQSVYNISNDQSNLERINRWNSAVNMFMERPVMGFGPGTYSFQYAPYQNVKDRSLISTNAGDLGNAHSIYFGALAETGFLGVIFIIGIFFITVATGMRVIYKATNNKVKGIAIGALCGLITYIVHGALNNYNDFDKTAVLMWGFTAIITALDVFHLKKIEATNQQNA